MHTTNLQHAASTSERMEDLAIDLSVDLGANSVPNRWNGYDLRLPGARRLVLRLAQEDVEGDLEVLLVRRNGVCESRAEFGSSVPVAAVAAFAVALVRP